MRAANQHQLSTDAVRNFRVDVQTADTDGRSWFFAMGEDSLNDRITFMKDSVRQ